MTKEDCVYFYEFQDMNARIQTCEIEAPKIIEPNCDKCNMYVKKDLVQVIRCKDCIKQQSYYHGPYSKLGMLTYYCFANGKHVKSDDFCSEGVRRGEVEE